MVTLVSLYALNSDQIEFLEEVLDKIDVFKERTLIVAGDLDYVIYMAWDKSYHTGKRPSTTNSKTRLKDFTTKYNSLDVWRLKNDSQQDYTYDIRFSQE